MTINRWLTEFRPIKNPERPQSDSVYGFRGFMFNVGCFAGLDSVDNDPYADHKVWSLIKDDEKTFLVNGFYPRNVEGFFITRVNCDKNYRISRLM